MWFYIWFETKWRRRCFLSSGLRISFSSLSAREMLGVRIPPVYIIEIYTKCEFIYDSKQNGGEGGIRTHVGLRPNGFQDRPVMTASVPLHKTTNYVAKYLVTHPRFELGTPWLKVKCSADWANGSNGWGNRTRTCGMQESKSCALPTWLYPNMVDESGFEPLKAKLTDLQSVPFGQLGYSSILKTLV